MTDDVPQSCLRLYAIKLADRGQLQAQLDKLRRIVRMEADLKAQLRPFQWWGGGVRFQMGTVGNLG